MRKLMALALAFAMAVCLSGSGFMPDFLELPTWAPKPNIPKDNPLTPAKIELGRHLFYDTRLSLNQSISCASCHIQAKAFSDGQTLSRGITGEITQRNTMGLTNVAYMPVLTWANPNLVSLEIQALVPLFGDHPIEMGMAGQEKLLFSRLKADPDYQRLFKSAYPRLAQSSPESLFSVATLTQALASFQRSLISLQSPYDAYKYGGKPWAISEAAKRGESLFFGEKLECYHCHGGFNFNDNVGHTRIPFPEIGFHNTGLFNLDGKGLYPAPNTGLIEFTADAADMGKFRTPSLRNVEVTAPYMHDGSMVDLRSVIKEHYAQAGRSSTKQGGSNPLRSPFIRGFEINEDEISDLVAFLKSLTDQDFLTHPRHSNPWPSGQNPLSAEGPTTSSAPERRAISKQRHP